MSNIISLVKPDTIFVIPCEKAAPKLSGGFEQYGIVYYIDNNKLPLMQALLSIKNTPEYKNENIKYVICCHDDLMLIDNNFITKKELAFKLFDYWGVAGTNMLLPSDPKWHVIFSPKKYLSGLMEHQTPEGELFMTSFGPYPRPVSVFDGVFMAFKKNVFEQIELISEYDGYHMYDMEICTQLWDKSFKGGIMGIHLFHQSRGEGLFSEQWNKYADIFRNRWSHKKVIGV